MHARAQAIWLIRVVVNPGAHSMVVCINLAHSRKRAVQTQQNIIHAHMRARFTYTNTSRASQCAHAARICNPIAIITLERRRPHRACVLNKNARALGEHTHTRFISTRAIYVRSCVCVYTPQVLFWFHYMHIEYYTNMYKYLHIPYAQRRMRRQIDMSAIRAVFE